MEDEIERNSTTLFTKNENSINQCQLLYICTPYDKKTDDCIITHDVNLVNNLLKEKKFKIEVFKKDDMGYKTYKVINN
jgi:5-methylthioribose kinase